MAEPRKPWPHPEGTSHAEGALGYSRAEGRAAEKDAEHAGMARESTAEFMDSKEIVKRLSDLAQLDIDAFHAYGQALGSIDDMGIKTNMERYQGDHERHYVELSQLIRQHGGTPPEFSRDFKGYLIQGMTSLRSAMGMEGALKAMKTNEELTNRQYSQASRDNRFPMELRPILDRFHGEEKTHLSFIEQTLKRFV